MPCTGTQGKCASGRGPIGQRGNPSEGRKGVHYKAISLLIFTQVDLDHIIEKLVYRVAVTLVIQLGGYAQRRSHGDACPIQQAVFDNKKVDDGMRVWMRAHINDVFVRNIQRGGHRSFIWEQLSAFKEVSANILDTGARGDAEDAVQELVGC